MAWCSLFGKMKSDVLYMCFALSDTEQVYLEPFRDTSLELNDLLWPSFLLPTTQHGTAAAGVAKEHWDNHHRFCTQWFRPDPLCCKQLDQHELYCSSKTDMSKLPDVSL